MTTTPTATLCERSLFRSILWTRQVVRAVRAVLLAGFIVAMAGCGTMKTKENAADATKALQGVKDVVRAVINESFGPTDITVDEAMFGGEPCGPGKEFYLWTANISPTTETGSTSIGALATALKAHSFHRLKRHEDWVAAVNESWGNKDTQVSLDITGMRADTRIEIKGTTPCVEKSSEILKP